MFTKFICQNDFRPLSTFIRGAVGSGKSAFIVNRRSQVQIRAEPNIEMMEVRFIIVFTKFICLNDFYPLCAFLHGAVALWLKRLSCKQGIRGLIPGSGKY